MFTRPPPAKIETTQNKQTDTQREKNNFHDDRRATATSHKRIITRIVRGTQFKWRQSEEQIEERGGRTPAPRAASPETTIALHLGKPIMRTSVGK